MNNLPREIVSEILLYFRNYKDELHISFKLGQTDIDMHLLIMNKYDNIWSKQTSYTAIKNIEEFYDELFKKYIFTEAEHIFILNKMQEINIFSKQKYIRENNISDNLYYESQHYTIYYKTYELEDVLKKAVGCF